MRQWEITTGKTALIVDTPSNFLTNYQDDDIKNFVAHKNLIVDSEDVKNWREITYAEYDRYMSQKNNGNDKV